MSRAMTAHDASGPPASTSRPALSREREVALMTAVGSGDLGALGEAYRLYARDVWRVLRRVLGSEAGVDIEDLVHLTFLKLPQIAGSFDGRAPCRAWLCGVAVRIGLRERRGARRLLAAIAEWARVVRTLDEADPEVKVGGREELAAFERALAALTAKKRAVFVLVEIDGLTQEEVAEALEIPAATARTRLFAARNELRQRMKKEGFG